jgi:hypothetical protein
VFVRFIASPCVLFFFAGRAGLRFSVSLRTALYSYYCSSSLSASLQSAARMRRRGRGRLCK